MHILRLNTICNSFLVNHLARDGYLLWRHCDANAQTSEFGQEEHKTGEEKMEEPCTNFVGGLG
jgi:hypothetical protein